MGFFSLIKSVFTASEIKISAPYTEIDTKTIQAISTFAVFSAIEYVANIASKVEYKTYKGGKEYKGYEWHSLNIKPNVNQSSTEFWKEAIGNLLYSGELLIIPVGRQKIIATDFEKDERAIDETTFKNIRRNDFTFNSIYKASEVFYIKYSNADMTAVLTQIIAALTTLVSEAVDKYIKSGGQKGTVTIPAAATNAIKDTKAFNEMFGAGFKSFYAAKNAVMPLTNGITYTPTAAPGTVKSSNEVSDIKNLIDEALTRAAQGYKIPPQLMLGNVSGIDDAMNLFLTVCIDPLMNCISEELSGKEFTAAEYIAGDYIDADTTNIKHIDIFSLAANVDKLISSGFTNIDETRTKAGLTATGEAWAQKHFITKNYEDISNMSSAGGGEK